VWVWELEDYRVRATMFRVVGNPTIAGLDAAFAPVTDATIQASTTQKACRD
jgi:hypothetical protein